MIDILLQVVIGSHTITFKLYRAGNYINISTSLEKSITVY